MVMVLGGSGTINATSTLALQTNNAQRVTVDSSGNAGFGTNTPYSAVGFSPRVHAAGSYPAFILEGSEGSGKKWTIGETAGSLAFYNDTDALERMRIDASGRVTRPYQPMFYARHNNNSSANGRYGLFDDVLTNQGGHASHSTFGGSYSYTRFTCPIAGKYFVWVGNIGPNTGTTQRTYVHKNGSNNSAQLRTGQTSNHGTSASMNVIIDAAANDWIACYSASDDGSMAFYSGEYSHMGVILIG